MAQFSYWGTGKQLDMHFNIEELAKRDAVNLLTDLMQLTGMTALLIEADPNDELGKRIYSQLNRWADSA